MRERDVKILFHILHVMLSPATASWSWDFWDFQVLWLQPLPWSQELQSSGSKFLLLSFPAQRFAGSAAAVSSSSMLGHDSIHWRKEWHLDFLLTKHPLSEDSYLNFFSSRLPQAFSDRH